MTSSAEELLRGVLPPNLHPAAVELAPYLVDSFGNATRIDYGMDIKAGMASSCAVMAFCFCPG